MAFTVTKTWVDGEVLYSADLNGNFDDVEGQIDSINTRQEWIYLETVTVSSGSTGSTSTLAAYDMYKVIFDAQDEVAGANNLCLRFNGDGSSTGKYIGQYITGTTITNYSASHEIILSGTSENIRIAGELIITGITAPVTSGYNTIGITSGYRSDKVGIVGHWSGGNAVQVTTMEFFISGGTMSGSFRVYGLNK